MSTGTRDSFVKGKDQYDRPPCTDLLRTTAFNTENIIFLFYKTSYLDKEVKCTEPSLSVKVP
jgi:hypothetical protein